MVGYIPYGRQDINQQDIDAVVEVLKSTWLTQGPVVPQFEEKIAQYCGAASAAAVNSATSALHIACRALGLGPGDWLWTSPITFVASANCGLYCEAQVDFVDIDPQTYNMSVTALEEKLAKAEQEGCLPKIVIPVHFAGQPCDMQSIGELAQRYGFKVIEDASHAIGGRYLNEPIGNCRYSDITVFSFHPVKIITAGEGGMALSNDAKLVRRMQLLRSHGITSDADEMVYAPDGPWHYQQIGLGFNYRMTDIHAALGLSQMQRLDEFVTKRHVIAKRYDVLLAELPVVIPWRHSGNYSALHLYVIRLNLSMLAKTHRDVFEGLRAAGIGVNLHYIPVYRQPYYADLSFKPGYCPEAEQYYSEAISLPIYPALTEVEQDQVVTTLEAVINA